MLTVRLASKGGDWVWVNMVMHIRQPFICDNGDPAIVCINQVISDAESTHFKMQSQLYSSHIARSPEFLSPSQSSSPPHTITTVPLEREQMQPTFTDLLQGDDPSMYQAFVTISSAPSVESGNGMSPQHGSALHTMQGGSRSGSLSDSTSSSSSPKAMNEHKQVLSRADIINRLKRKMSEMAAKEQCKPAKVPKVVGTGNDQTHGGIRISGSAFIAPLSDMVGLSSHSVGSYDRTQQVLAPATHHGPMPHDLVLRKEVEMLIPEPVCKQPPATVTEFSHPPTPSTPGSVTSEAPEKTSLTIDVTQTSLVPLSILTPDSSPSSSPIHKVTMFPSSQLEQQVPTLADLDDFNDFENETLLKSPEVKKESDELDFELNLPELDSMAIETYFAAVEGGEMKRILARPDIKVEPLSPPYSHTDSPPPAPSPLSENAASPAVSVIDTIESVNSPGPKVKTNNEADRQNLPSLSDTQLDNLVATVTEALLDMVQQSADKPNSGHTVTGGFMLVPDQRNSNKADDLSVEVPEMDVTSAALPDPLAEAALLNELHQLDQLAGSTPSYGMYPAIEAMHLVINLNKEI